MMKYKASIQNILNKLPYIRGLYQQNLQYKKNCCYPPGHFYSTIPDLEDIRKKEAAIWENILVDNIQGVNLNTEQQLNLVKEFYTYYNEIPFAAQKQEGTRYYFENGLYSYTDAIFLYSMIRHIKPKRIIEIGSGFSSAVMLDTNEKFFNNSIKLHFIEPYPQRLYSLINNNGEKNVSILQQFVQDIPITYFEQLEAGDILFVDSSHVVKTGSDVHYILFKILPILKAGVFIHFHDIFYPFEYPKDWVYMGRNWNEDYFVKAFLMYNDSFSIQLFAHYLHSLHKEIFAPMPLCYKNEGGNLWLQKTV